MCAAGLLAGRAPTAPTLLGSDVDPTAFWFSPDGTHLAFVSDLYSTATLKIATVTNPNPVAVHADVAGPVTFSPDGSLLVFGAWNGSSGTDLNLVKASAPTTATQVLGASPYHDPGKEFPIGTVSSLIAMAGRWRSSPIMTAARVWARCTSGTSRSR